MIMGQPYTWLRRKVRWRGPGFWWSGVPTWGKKSRYGYTARDRAQLEKKEDVEKYLENVMRQGGMEVRELDEEEDDDDDEEEEEE